MQISKTEVTDELASQLATMIGAGPSEVLLAYALKLTEGGRDIDSVLVDMLDDVKSKGAGVVLALASRDDALISMEIEVAGGVREVVTAFGGANWEDPMTIREVRRAVIRYLAKRFPTERAAMLSQLVTEHVSMGGRLVISTSAIVADLWKRGRR